MKRYFLFAGPIYYPYGGWGDFKGSFDTIEDAQEVVNGPKYGWYQIVDGTTGEIVDDNAPWSL